MTPNELIEISKRNDDYCINNDCFCEQCPLGKRRCLRWYSIELTSETAEERAIKAKEFFDENAK